MQMIVKLSPKRKKSASLLDVDDIVTESFDDFISLEFVMALATGHLYIGHNGRLVC